MTPGPSPDAAAVPYVAALVSYSHQVLHNRIANSIQIFGFRHIFTIVKRRLTATGVSSVTKKIAVVAVLCAVVALVACRREEYRPLKLGGPVAEQPAR
jgi:hypothetical protein